LAYTGDIQAGDPGCIYNNHQWQELTDAAGLEAREEESLPSISGTMAAQLVQIAATQALRTGTRLEEFPGITRAASRQPDGQRGA
jgi:hypothetical protein